MTLEELYDRIGMDADTRAAVAQACRGFDHAALRPLWEQLYDPTTWDAGIRALQAALDPDENGIKMLACLSLCALRTHDEYVRQGISEQIFDDTMQFLARFAATDRAAEGKCAFRRGWWFPRQLAMREFRIGAFEYECAENERGKCINLHIPGGADLREQSAFASYAAAHAFFAERFPDYLAGGVYCESWLMTPALHDLLDSNSNILRFQSDFACIRTDEDSPAAMDWIFGSRSAIESLPEKTSLQRRAKQYLASGKKIGWTLAKLKQEHWQ